MTTLAERIRAEIKAAPEGLYLREVAERLGLPSSRVQASLKRMRRIGLVTRLGHGGRKGVRYGIGRDLLKVWAHPPEEAERLRIENHRRANREYKRRKAAERPPRPAKPAPLKDRPPYQPREVATAPVRETLPDSSAWLAANEGKYERLPDGAVSKASRLRFDYRRQA